MLTIICVLVLTAITLLFCITTDITPTPIGEPLTDEEFIAQCDVPPEVALGVRKVLADALGLDESTIHPDHRLIEDLGAGE